MTESYRSFKSPVNSSMCQYKLLANLPALLSMSPRTEIVILDVWLIVGFCVYIVLWEIFWISIECEPTRRCIGKVEHIGGCGYKARWLDPTFDTYCSVTMIVGDEHANAATPRSDFLYSSFFSLPESQPLSK